MINTIFSATFTQASKNLLWLEFIVFYLMLPLIYACNRKSSPGIYLIVLSLIGFIILFKNDEFSNKIFFNRNALLCDFPGIAVFLFVTVLLLLLTYTFYPESGSRKCTDGDQVRCLASNVPPWHPHAEIVAAL